jgi:hypothetical protein
VPLLHDSVEVPEPPPIVVAVNEHTRLVELVVGARLTAPVKPFTGTMEIVAVPAVLTVVETVVGFAVTLKSCSWYVTDVEWDRAPLVPVTVAR